MSRIIRVLIQYYLHQNKNREEVKNRVIRYLPDLSIFNTHSVFVLVQRILIDYPNYPTHRLYFGKVEIPYTVCYSLITMIQFYQPIHKMCESFMLFHDFIFRSINLQLTFLCKRLSNQLVWLTPSIGENDMHENDKF